MRKGGCSLLLKLMQCGINNAMFRWNFMGNENAASLK